MILHSGTFASGGVKSSPPLSTDHSVDPLRSSINSRKRAVSAVFDYARSNTWDYFITLTFDPAVCDRYSYSDCSALVQKFTDALRYRDCKWLIVAETHADGAYHFHGLISGNLPVTPSGHSDRSGDPIYNIDIFPYGFTTATFIKSQSRCASYVAKYLTKQSAVPKGKKRYWASRSLLRPDHMIMTVTPAMLCDISMRATFSKKISNQYGEFDFYEISG